MAVRCAGPFCIYAFRRLAFASDVRSVYTCLMSALTPQQFVANWSNTQLKESASYMTHFDDLCELVNHAKPAHLYNENPTWLQLAHRKLDDAVLDAYGWPRDLSDDEVLARLLALNLERAGK